MSEQKEFEWYHDPFWIDAQKKADTFQVIGHRQLVIDLDAIEKIVYRGDGPAYKMMETMHAIKESQEEGYRSAPRVLLALLAQLACIKTEGRRSAD